MFGTTTLAVELTGCRLSLCRLQRYCSHHEPRHRLVQCHSISQLLSSRDHLGIQRVPSQRLYAQYSTATTAPPSITTDDFDLVKRLVSRHGSVTQICDRLNDHTPSGHVGSRDVDAAVKTTKKPEEVLPKAFQRALEAMQQKDSRRLLMYLRLIASMPEEVLISTLQTLPRTTFSELLRSLDPFVIGSENDPTYGEHISPNMWSTLNLMGTIDVWGVRKLYTRLFQRMLMLREALLTSGGCLNVNDYLPILRAAGAASDMAGAKLLWTQMKQFNAITWRNTTSYDDFIRARLLIDPLYYSHDKTRIMCIPRNLHRKGDLQLSQRKVKSLDRLRLNTRKKRMLFGLNKNVERSEDISRVLRSRGPPTGILRYMRINDIPFSESVISALTIAFGRAGSLRFIKHRILEDLYGISLNKDKRTGEITVKPAEKPERVGQRSLARFRTNPSQHVLYALVQVYCSNGEISMAFQLLDYMSTVHRLPLNSQVWFELLEWTYIMSMPPTSTAWKMAGMLSKVPNPSAVEMVWKTMTSAPYKVQPGFNQYDILIRSLISRGVFDEAFQYMAAARKFYEQQSARYEKAVFDYTRALRDGVNITPYIRVYHRALFQKQRMWFCISNWCRVFLKNRFRSCILDDPMTNRQIPHFVKEYREFVSNPACYRTATGYVQLYDPAHEFMHRVVVQHVDLEVPMKSERKWRLLKLRRRVSVALSGKSLAERRATRLNPLRLLMEDRELFRLVQLPPEESGVQGEGQDDVQDGVRGVEDVHGVHDDDESVSG